MYSSSSRHTLTRRLHGGDSSAYLASSLITPHSRSSDACLESPPPVRLTHQIAPQVLQYDENTNISLPFMPNNFDDGALSFGTGRLLMTGDHNPALSFRPRHIGTPSPPHELHYYMCDERSRNDEERVLMPIQLDASKDGAPFSLLMKRTPANRNPVFDSCC